MARTERGRANAGTFMDHDISKTVRPRFYVPSALGGPDEIELPPQEAHHLRHVLRLTAGAHVRVFDGRGHEWNARVVAVRAGVVRLHREAPVTSAPEPAVAMTLALGVLKGAFMDRVIRDAAMVGVTTIQPIVTDRTVARLGRGEPDTPVARWQRIALASIKQCGRAVVPEVRPVQHLTAWLKRVPDEEVVKIVLVEPGLQGQTSAHVAELRQAARSHGARLLAGPEGGWTVKELAEAAEAGYQAWTAGDRVLRADAIPVAALSVLFYLWDRD